MLKFRFPITSISKIVEEKTLVHFFLVNINWWSHYGKQCEIKKFKIEIPYDPVIPLLGIYPKKTKTLIQKDICTPMFIAMLFMIAKLWKQLKLSINRWIKKLWYI